MTVVLANGCFDPLHAGHVAHLRAARKMGTRLVVALTTDAALAREKGDGRPFVPWHERAAVLRELRCVSQVIPSESGRAAILQVRPDIFVKGIDYRSTGIDGALADLCEGLGIRVAFTGTEKRSSTELIRRMRRAA